MNLEALLTKIYNHMSVSEIWKHFTNFSELSSSIHTIRRLIQHSPENNAQVAAHVLVQLDNYGQTEGLSHIPEVGFNLSECEFNHNYETSDTGVVFSWQVPVNTPIIPRFRPLSSPNPDEQEYNQALVNLNSSNHMPNPLKGLIVSGFTSQGDILNNGIQYRNSTGRIQGTNIPASKGGIGYNFSEREIKILTQLEMQNNSGYDLRVGAPITFDIDILPETDYELMALAKGISKINEYTSSENIDFMFMGIDQDNNVTLNLTSTSDFLADQLTTAFGMRVSTLQACIYNVLKHAKPGQRYISCEENTIAYPKVFENGLPNMMYPMEFVIPL